MFKLNIAKSKYILSGIVALTIIGCASTDKDITAIPARELLDLAREATSSAQYDKAISYYEQIEARFPYTVFSRQALLDQAFSYYQQSEDDRSLVTIDRFIKLYPKQDGADYAHYLKGLIYYGKGRGVLDFLVEASTAERDLEASIKSSEAFKTVINEFPNSPYVADATLRNDLLFNQMGQYEVNISRFYYNRGAYVAAINRAAQTIKQFHRSQAQEEALVVIAKSYDKLALTEFRDNTLSILNHNYPQTRFASEINEIAPNVK